MDFYRGGHTQMGRYVLGEDLIYNNYNYNNNMTSEGAISILIVY